MKQKKYFFKKFHKKYVFLQNSLFDFVYWRSQKSIQQRKKIFMNTRDGSNLQKVQNLTINSQQPKLLEQEKIFFQEYWQSSEFQKIKTEIQNRNKEFQNLDISSNLNSKEFKNSLKNEMNFSKFEKSNFKDEMWNSLPEENSKIRKFQKPLFFPYTKKKQTQKAKYQIYLSSFSKRNKFEQIHPSTLSSYSETFIPKSDCFRRIEKFDFLNLRKCGKFFPKGKNFQQYWIFPLLGFVLFFPGGVISDISNFSNRLRKFSIPPLFESIRTENQIEHFNRENSENLLKRNFVFQNQSFNNSLHFNDSDDSLTPKKVLSMYDFSYTNTKSLDNAFSLQKLETTEFEKLSNFYLEKFNKIFLSFLIDRKSNEFVQKFIFQKNFEQELFKKGIVSKRNVLNWQWFTVKTTPFLSSKNNISFQNFNGILPQKNNSFGFGQNDMPQNILNLRQYSPLKIPHKAKFFMNNFFDTNLVLLQKNKNSTFQFAPIFHFGNSRSIFNEFEKNLFFSPHFFSRSLKFVNLQTFDLLDESQGLKMYPNVPKKNTSIESLVFQSNFNLTNNEIQKFFKNLKKEKKTLLNSWNFFKKENSLNNFFYFFKDSVSDTKILQKWLQTQHVWHVRHTEKKLPYANKKFLGLYPNENLQSVVSKKKFATFQISQEILQILTDVQQKLDAVYFQKMCKPFISKFTLVSSFENKHSRVKEQKFFAKSKVSTLVNLTNQKKIFLQKKLYEVYVRKYWSKQLKNMFLKRFELFQFPKKNDFSIPETSSNSEKSSFLILNQLPLFLDFGVDFSENISSQVYAFSQLQLPHEEGRFDFPNLNFQKYNEKNENGRIDARFLRKSFFQTFVFNFQNSHLFLNNFEFFSNNMTSNYFHLGKYLFNVQNQNFHKFINVEFVRSKLNVFEKVLTKLKANSLLNMSSLNMFKTTFFFEKMKKPQACTFQAFQNPTSQNFQNLSDYDGMFWYISNQIQKNKENSGFSNFSKSKLQNSKFQKIFGKENRSLRMEYRYSPNFFSQKQNSFLSKNFSLRKFEKVFQKSFSYFQQNKFKKLKNQQNSFEKNLLSTTKFNDISNQTPISKDLKKVVLFRKQFKDASKPDSSFFDKNSFLPMHSKSKKENILLRSLSTSFQNFYNSSQSSILLLSNQKKSKKIQTSLDSFDNFYYSDPSENFLKKPWTNLSTEEISKMIYLQNKKEFEKNANFVAPDIILKRDGFLFYPSKQKSFLKNQNLQIFKIFEYSETQKYNKSFSLTLLNKQNKVFFSNFQENSQKQNNRLFEQRFEKEKHLQRKRRLKKQKLETRRRKKRKRFFPRPVWLRFHLYKKFLNIRHSSKPMNKKPQWEFLNSNYFVKNNLKNKKKYTNFCMFNSLRVKNNRIQKNIFLPKQTYENVHSFFMPFSKTLIVPKYKQIQKNSFLLSKYKKNMFDSKNFENNLFGISKYKILTKKENYEFLINKLYDKNIQKWGFSGQKMFAWASPKSKSLIFQKNRFLKKFVSNSYFLQSKDQSFLKRNSQNFVSKNIENYKISGEILSEFARLSWKSYWFQTNIEPYQQKIFKNFQKMKEIEGKKNLDQYSFFDFFGNQQFSWFNTSQLLRCFFFSEHLPFHRQASQTKNSDSEMKSTDFSNFNFFKFPLGVFAFQEFDMFSSKNQPFQNISFWNMDLQNNFLLRKSIFKKFLWYLNIQTSLNSNVLQNDCSIFQQVQNIPEYNRILYSRVSKILKNLKSLETNEEFFLKNALSKVPKRKNENMSISNTNFSFFTKSALFFENFTIPSRPFIPAFSLFSSLFQDSSLKPTGELPTLRALWAFHQTNFFHFQEKNEIRNVWTFKKRRDSFKNLKGTKKIFSFFRKFNNTEKVQNIFSNDVFICLPKIKSTKTLNSFLASNFTSNSKSDFHKFLNQLDNMSFFKFQNAEKKSSLFGLKSLKQNSKLSLRYLKFHLVSKSKSSLKHSCSCFEKNQILKTPFEKDSTIQNETYSSVFYEKKSNPLNSAKSSFNYWWAQRNNGYGNFMEKVFPFFLSSSNSSNFSIDFEFNFSNPLIFQNMTLLNSEKSMQKGSSFQNFGIGKVQFICLGAILFHFAIFMTLFKIPEIRSVFKFQCLIFYKLFNSFSILLFSIYDFLKKYIDQIVHVFQFYFSFHQKKKNMHFGNFSRKNFKVLPSSYSLKIENRYSTMEQNFVLNFPRKVSNPISHRNFLFEFFIRISKFSMVPNSSVFYGKNENFPMVFVVSEKFPIFKNRNQIFNFQIQKIQNFGSTFSKSKFSLFQRNVPVFQKTGNQKFRNKNVENSQNIQNMYMMNQISYLKKYKENLNFFVFCSTSLNFSKKILNTLKKQYFFQHQVKQKNIQNSFFKKSSFFYSSASFPNAEVSSKQFWKIRNSQTSMYQKISVLDFNKNIVNVCEKDFKNLFMQEIPFLQENSIPNLMDSRFNDQYISTVFFPWTKTKFQASIFPLFPSKQNLVFSEKKQKEIGSKNAEIQRKSQYHLSSFENISSNSEKFFSELALSFLIVGKSLTLISFNVLKCGSSISKFVLNIIEFFMFSIYKFLEKPAELMIEWIALIFLIEWSSDGITFIPDTLDISVWKSSQKFLRPIRSGSLAVSFFNSSISGSVVANSVNFMYSINSFSYSNIVSFIVYKRFLYFIENFAYQLTLPDIDIFIRQKKGMIFWDIWSEILLKAAEKYNVNIPSFVTLKEEQELFIEKLLQDTEFFKSIFIENSFSFSGLEKKIQNSNNQNGKNMNFETIQQNSLKSYIQNFLIQEKPNQLSSNSFDFLLNTNSQAKIVENSMSIYRQNFSSNTLYSPWLELWGNRTNSNGETQNISSGNKNILNFIQNISIQKGDSSFGSNAGIFKFSKNSDSRACNQYNTYQSLETDLFVDLHPSKSFQHIHYFKYYESAQYTLGPLICQVYAGIFSKKVSKNILLIGSPGTAKTLFVQALAGETEMKIITDNAYRYSTVLRGVAVGMKYLRDVFDAIALQTPCFFLMEHIHVIGSKRPLLISDDENGKGVHTSFGLDQQEVHETNQMIYQSTKHSISDSKRPYKGDFSMGIPTNFFVQNFYSKIEKNSFSIFQNSQFSFGGTSSTSRHSPTYPLPIDSIENSLNQQNFGQKERSDTNFLRTPSSSSSGLNQNFGFENRSFQFQTSLQLSKEQVFAPPATSPFAVLMMKEQKKFIPKKVVQENSWGGVTGDQLLSYQKESISIRSKVATLADMTMNLSRGKLDMITDLLVILDSVRSNRGFVVFGTTHIPSSLDPALRRPGRFDETISLAQNTNFLNRFEILKIQLSNSISTLDFFDSSIMTENFSEIDLMNLIVGTKLSFFHQYKFTKNFNFPFQETTIFSQISPQKAFQSFLKSLFFHNFYKNHPIFQYFETNKTFHFSKYEKNSTFFSKDVPNLEVQPQTNISNVLSNNFTDNVLENSLISESSKQNFPNQFKFSLRNPKLSSYTMLPKAPSHILNFAYSRVGQVIIQLNLLKDPTCLAPLKFDISRSVNIQELIGNSLWNSQKQQKLQFMFFLSGKISEFFATNDCNIYSFESNSNLQKSDNSDFVFSKNSTKLFDRKFLKFHSIDYKDSKYSLFKTNLDTSQTFQEKMNFFDLNSKTEKFQSVVFTKEYKMNIQSFSFLNNSYFSSVFGNDDAIRSTTMFLFSIVQKRFLFTKNLLLSKLLFFENRTSRKQPPSPPISSILMPSKKYENFKRTENDFQRKARFSINEKIQFHQQQRFLKQLYSIPVQQYFRSETVQKRQTFFGNSFQEIGYLDSLTTRSSSIHFYQRRYIGFRHRFSNINQWWTGFLPEHTPESTYLSDVDWRTMFISKNNQSQSNIFRNKKLLDGQSSQNSPFFNKNKKFPWGENTSKSLVHTEQQNKNIEPSHTTLEYTMDFPDSEHYYSPRNRRWYFNANSKMLNRNASYWLNFDTNLQYEIHHHFLIQSFQETYQYFDKNREMLDFFVFSLLKTGFLKELDYLTTTSRFQKFFI
jgi:SpoVK/Ycf46/Vps4 family AAA+-type ATPase